MLSIVLVAAPERLGGGMLHTLPFLLPLLVTIGWAYPRQVSSLNPLMTVFVSLYLLCTVISLFRGPSELVGVSKSLSVGLLFATVTAFGLVVVNSAANPRDRNWRLSSVALAPAVYVGVNVLLLPVVGEAPTSEFSSAQGTSAQLLGFFGIHTTRILYPLSSGVNFFGGVAAAGLAASIILGTHKCCRWRVCLPAALLCLYGILATDSRGPLAIAILVTVLFLVVPRLSLSGFMPLLIAFAPVLVITLLGVLAKTDLLALLSREGLNAYTATGRLFIWHAIYESVLSHPSAESLIGWGAYGQIDSGALLHYSFLDPADPILSAHSFTLQTILDVGYVGLAIALTAVAIGAGRLTDAARTVPASTALLAILAVIYFAGTTESMPTFLDPAGMALAFLVLGIATVETPARKGEVRTMVRERPARPALRRRLAGHPTARR